MFFNGGLRAPRGTLKDCRGTGNISKNKETEGESAKKERNTKMMSVMGFVCTSSNPPLALCFFGGRN